MDPVNFLEFKNTEDKCRSIASNTVPIACANCGSNDYNIQTLQQANYLTPLYPGIPSLKLTSDSFKDNFPINSPFFPRPFFHPVLHNSSILSNPFYGHNIGLMLQNPYRHLSEEHTQGKCESNNKSTQVSNCSEYFLNQTHQRSACNDDINFNKFQPKDSNAGGDTITKDIEAECHPKNSEESDTNYSSQCVCNNQTPWLYSPFVLPIISYYILWNSQCSNPKLPPGNYSCSHSQMRQNTKEDDETKVSDTSSKEEKEETDFNEPKEKLPKKSKDGVSEDFWTDDKIPKSEWRINNQKNGSSSSFFSISSLDYGEDIFFYTKRKSEAKTMSNNCGIEMGFGKSNAATSPNEHKGEEKSAVKCETNQSDTHDAELDEKVRAYPSASLSADIEEEEEEEGEEEVENEIENENNENDDDDVDEDDDKYVKTSNEESLIQEQVSDLKIQNGFQNEIEMVSSEIEYKAADIPSEDTIVPALSKSSQETVTGNDSEDKKPMSDYSESLLKDRVTYKKTIKNFTMADETNLKFYEESKTLASMAAGGDLGGEHCVGYRIEISPPPRQRGNVQNINKNEDEMETNEILLKDLEELTDRSKENNENSTDMKNSLESGEFENKSMVRVKPGRNFKSGIAKLSSNFKPKCINSNPKNSEVKNCVTEMPKTRRKHNCMAIIRTTENNEGNSKIQKSKYSRERQGKNLDSPRENVPPNKIRKQSTRDTDSREKRKDQTVRAPCKSST